MISGADYNRYNYEFALRGLKRKKFDEDFSPNFYV